MKKVLFITFVCLLATSCAAPAPRQTPPAPAEPLPKVQLPPVFQLKALPELPPYDAPWEIASRYYDEPWVDELRPAEDYGMLYPYLGYFRAFDIFYEYRYGLVDKAGRIVVDPVYNQVNYLTNEQGEPAFVVVYPINESPEPKDMLDPSPPPYRVYDMCGNLLEEGEGYAAQYEGRYYYSREDSPAWASYSNDHDVDLPGLMGVKEVGDGWLAAHFSSRFATEADPEGKKLKQGLALIRGEQEFIFENTLDPFVDCQYARGDKLLLYYSPTSKAQGYCEVFDATRGEVIQRIENRRLWKVLNEKLLAFNTPDKFDYYQVFNLDFQPVFDEREFGGSLTNIEHVVNDVYSVRTSVFSGLIRENGEWLLRVYINNLD